MDVTNHRQEILFRIDQDGFVTAAKQRAVSMMDAIELLCVKYSSVINWFPR